MRALRPSSARSPAPSPPATDVFVAGGVSSPPLPYAVGSPGPAPEPSEAVAGAAEAAAGGRRGGGVGGSLSPPLIAMLAVVGAALMVVLYARLVSRVFRAARRRWRRRRRLRLLMFPGGSPASDSFASFTTYDNYYHTYYSPYHHHGGYCDDGLDDAAIKSLPSAQFFAGRRSGAARECAVCLLEFADGDEVRALPLCAHAFHADCIDVWLRAHASCPLCRAAIVASLPPPVASPSTRRAVRPSLDDLLFFHPVPPLPAPENDGGAAEIAPASPDQQLDPRDFLLLKRSYSLGFERSLAVEAASTASPPWRYRASRGARSSFWSKRWPSPFGGASASAAARVFSFRSYRSANATKSSPFSRRRGAATVGGGGSGSGFFFTSLASEPPSILASSARRNNRTAAASSSRLRCGDPEALVSPDRLSSSR